MFRRSLFSFSLVIVALLTLATIATAQNAPSSGKVVLQKADGSTEPVVGAVVDVYRIDIKSKFPSTKTNKNGEFSFAGLQLGANYTLSVSAADCAPTVFPNVKAAQDRILVTLLPGDGSKFTEEQVRKGIAQASTSTEESGELTADQKKAKEDYEAQVKAVEEKNKKVEKTNEIINRTLKEGNSAYEAKNYDLALAKFDEGYNADPNFIGAAPTFLNNRGIVLTSRAVETYNKAMKATDATEKFGFLNSTKKDLADAADAFLKSWNLLKTSSNPADKSSADAKKVETVKIAKDTFWKAVRTEQVDEVTVNAAKVLIPEYIAVEADSVKKAEAGVIFADLYRVGQDFENAVVAYKSVLEKSPDNLDATAYLGLVLVDLSWQKNNDKALAQEGANYLQKFVAAAPDSNKLKDGAKGYLDILKEQNIAPQKAPATKRKN